jgi:hypothetical protein
MTPGKAQAHSGHAANAFIKRNYIDVLKDVRKPANLADPTIFNAIEEWMNATPQGFGTQINLKGAWDDVIYAVNETDDDNKVVSELITDPTYPYIVDSEVVNLIDPAAHSIPPVLLSNGMYLCHRQEVTAAYIFGRKEDATKYVEGFSLHP